MHVKFTILLKAHTKKYSMETQCNAKHFTVKRVHNNVTAENVGFTKSAGISISAGISRLAVWQLREDKF